MNVDIQKSDDTEAEITVELSPDEVEKYKQKAAYTLSQNNEIKGFRKGKAPLRVVEQELGKDRLFKETVDIAVRESYVSALSDNDLMPVGQPEIKVKKAAPGNPLVFTAHTALMPKVELGDYTSISVSISSPEVEESEVDSALETLKKSRANYQQVDRPAKKGDRVEVDFTVKKNGAVIEGGKSTQHPLIIGEEHFMPGFEDKLIGMKAGDEKEFSLTAPKDYHNKDLAGKKLEFEVTMNQVQEVELPELNDDFAKKLGKFSSVDELKENVRKGLKEEKMQRENEKLRLKMVEKIVAQTSFEVPQVLIDQELDKMEQEFMTSLKRMNVDKESYLSHLKKSVDDMREEWHDKAIDRVKAALVLKTIAEEQDITVSEDEIEERAAQVLDGVSAKEAENIDAEGLQSYIRGSIRNEKVFQYLEQNLVN